LSLINNNDGETTTISCGGEQIASTSGTKVVYLDSGDVTVTDCSNFVTCSTLPSLEISNIKFKFGIGASTSGVGITQNFEMDVTVRN
jgi:hypothetical protein